jgi:hypothetical protein
MSNFFVMPIDDFKIADILGWVCQRQERIASFFQLAVRRRVGFAHNVLPIVQCCDHKVAMNAVRTTFAFSYSTEVFLAAR